MSAQRQQQPHKTLVRPARAGCPRRRLRGRRVADQHVLPRRADRPHREPALHAVGGHRQDPRQDRRAGERLSVLLGQGDGQHPGHLRTYAGRVREMLEEFAARSEGKLVLQVIDPLPFSEEEDRASGFGLRPINAGNSADPIYLGVAGTNSVGDDDIIPFLDPAKESFLEYDLAKLVSHAGQPEEAGDRPADGTADDRRVQPDDAASRPALGDRRTDAPAVRRPDARCRPRGDR